MNINHAALELIKRFEGLRLESYRCAAGVWTIGYGHTSEAGEPRVKSGMRITRSEADEIFASDIDVFANGLRGLIRAPLNANQFGALVSFAYNVGVGAFRQSSVLRAVNDGKFDQVPRRLNLWTKAGGRVLAGLVKRRAAEGVLFMKDPRGMHLFEEAMSSPLDSELSELQLMRGSIDWPLGKELTRSTTVWATIGGWFSTLGALAAGLQEEARKAMWNMQEWLWFFPAEHYGKLMLAGVATACMVWIIRERRRKALDEDV